MEPLELSDVNTCQFRFPSYYSVYGKKADCIILAFSGDSSEETQTLVDFIQSQIRGVYADELGAKPIIIVQTKFDELGDKKIDFKQGIELARKCEAVAYFPTSAKLNIGIDELFYAAMCISLAPTDYFGLLRMLERAEIACYLSAFNQGASSEALFSLLPKHVAGLVAPNIHVSPLAPLLEHGIHKSEGLHTETAVPVQESNDLQQKRTMQCDM